MKMTLDQHETALWSKDGPDAESFRRYVVDFARRFAATTHAPVHIYNAYGTALEKAGPSDHKPADPPHAEPGAPEHKDP